MPRVEKQITVQAPPEVVYQVWRNFDNFPSFMDNVAEVRMLDENRSHWKAKEPLGQEAEWDAEITLDERGRAIEWRSLEGTGNVRTQGRVDFVPKEDGTRLHLVLEYEPAAGGIRDLAAKIFANPEEQVEEDLRCFKEGIESGHRYSMVYEGERVSAAARLLAAEEGRDEGEAAIREDRPAVPSPEGESVPNPYRDETPHRRHGTPGGSLGSLNETENIEQDRTSEKTDPRADAS